MKSAPKNISIIIPFRNKKIDIQYFVTWINHALSSNNPLEKQEALTYELIFITDTSTNTSVESIEVFPQSLPVKIYVENENLGKGSLCAKAFTYAQYDILAIIDPTVKYPMDMLRKIITKLHDSTDVIVAFPKRYMTKNTTEIHEEFGDITDSFLFALQKEPQAGALLFSKDVWRTIAFTSSSDKTFAGEFIHRAQELGFIVRNFNIFREENISPNSLVDYFRAGIFVIGIKIKKIHPQYILPTNAYSMINAGLRFKKHKYVTHTTLSPTQSAIESFDFKQIFITIIAVEAIVLGLLLKPLIAIQMVIGILSMIYFIDVLFNLFLVLRTIRKSHEIRFVTEEFESLKNNNLPIYTILCPLYKEAHMIAPFLKGIENLEWPSEKLDVILLLEEDDTTSIEMVDTMQIPSYVRKVVVPHSMPKTKPKACNYGLAYAKGAYTVIYDAEDIPDPLQLKKAYIAFNKLSRNVVCLQAKLNYYNPNQNLLTRFFTAEYSLWFDISLAGLQSLKTSIPLGGTSNHFRTDDLTQLHAWDPFNVTEDADLGMRLFKQGYQTAIIDSVTLEEANSKVGNWLRQRSRWIKGYMQTYLVHTRDIIPFIRQRGIHALIFHLVIGGRIAFIFINPLLWILTIFYFTFHGIAAPLIDAVYTPVILYIAISTLIFGNSLYLFCYMLGCVKSGQWSLIKYVYLIPLYWLMISVAGWIAFYQLLFKPHYWEKTVHGLHLKKKTKLKIINFNITNLTSLIKVFQVKQSLPKNFEPTPQSLSV